MRPGQGPQWAKGEDFWQQRTKYFSEDKTKEYERYPMVTAKDLRERRERPRRVKMLIRDFIEGTRIVPSSWVSILIARSYR